MFLQDAAPGMPVALADDNGLSMNKGLLEATGAKPLDLAAATFLQARKLNKRFDAREAAVKDLSLEVARGETVAIIGPSGAGKTTLFRMLNLSVPPDEGTLSLDGVEVQRLNPRQLRDARRRIGSIYQQHDLVGQLRVVHNVLSGQLGRWSTWRAMLSLARPFDARRAYDALRAVGLSEKLYERTDHLSGGQQQRVALARILVQDPELILADEPVASVDPQLADELIELLVTISRNAGKTLIASLHHVALALKYFERIIGLSGGVLRFDCSPRDVTPTMLEELYGGDRVFGHHLADANQNGASGPLRRDPTTCLHFDPPSTTS